MTFSNGVIKSLEKELLNRAALSRIIDEPSYNSALKSVKEQGFGRNVQTDNVDILAEAETAALDDFVREFSPSKEYSAYCLKKIDYFNAEKYLRSKYIRGYGYEEKRTGLIENIADKIDKKDKELPKELLAAVSICCSASSCTMTPSAVTRSRRTRRCTSSLPFPPASISAAPRACRATSTSRSMPRSRRI